MEKWIDSSIAYDGAIIKVRVGEVELEDGTRAKREVVEHNGGVGVVPYTGHSVILVRQYRIAVGDYVLEIPAGKMERRDEDPAMRARAELREETGYEAGRLDYVGYVYCAIGFCTERAHIFLGLDLKKVSEQQLDHDERVEIVEVPISEIRENVEAHRYIDAKTMLGLQALLRRIDQGTA